MKPKTVFGYGYLFIYVCLVGTCLANPNAVAAQEEGSKGIKPDEAGIKVNPNRKTRRAITFRTPNRFTRRPAPRGTEYAQLGVTIWRVDRGRSIEQEGEEQTIERLDTGAPYTDGDRIRLTIESPTKGFMYIVDQERYADGSYGLAMLVFPTLKTSKGNNFIDTWRTVEVPAYPAVWRFTPRKLKEGEVRKEQTAEVLTIILAPNPLVARNRIGEKPLALNKGEFENWRAQWQKRFQRFDVEGYVGQVITKGVEQQGEEAGSEDEIGAQTTYQVAIRPGRPIFVTVPLRFKTSAPLGVKN